MHRCLTLISSLLLVVPSARAATLTVSESGVFGTTTPTTSYSTPGGAFAYSFLISTTPAVSGVSPANYFSPAISNFTYTLNGVTTSPAVGSLIVYNLANDAGLFDLCFAATCASETTSGADFQMTGPQIYTGSEASPTILAGTYLPASSYFVNNGLGTALLSASTITIAATPEPSSIALLGSGLLAAATLLRRRKP